MADGLECKGLVDMHCHLDFPEDGTAIAKQATWHMLSMTVDPRDYPICVERFKGIPNVHIAAGLHPWWVADGTCGADEASMAAELVRSTRFVGEIGLDFAQRHADTREAQTAAFNAIVRACAREGDKVLSIHALRSADAVLDVLEHHAATNSCSCILHWFSGSSQELKRAIRMGCLFSLNDRMMQTGRGREYAKAIPLDRLLLETDLPTRQGEPCSTQILQESLGRTLHAIEQARRAPCTQAIAQNATRILKR